jgi:hypothetical protein
MWQHCRDLDTLPVSRVRLAVVEPGLFEWNVFELAAPIQSPAKCEVWNAPQLWFPHQNPLCPSPLIRALLPANLIILDFITRIIFGEKYRSLNTSLCSFLYSPFTSSHLGPNIFLNNLLSNNRSLCSSLNVSDQVSDPYKQQAKL